MTSHTRIMVVEDDLPLLGLIDRFLEGAGYDVCSACDGAEAIRLADASPNPIDLLVTDVVLPHVNGFDLAATIVAQHPDTQILYMSGYADARRSVGVGLRECGRSFLKKPFTRPQFLRSIHEALTTPRSRATEALAAILGTSRHTARQIAALCPPQGVVRPPRYQVRVPARYRRQEGGEWHGATAENISQSGLLLWCDRPPGDWLTPPARLDVVLDVPPRTHPSPLGEVHCPGTVVRIVQPKRSWMPAAAVGVAVDGYYAAEVGSVTHGVSSVQDVVR